MPKRNTKNLIAFVFDTSVKITVVIDSSSRLLAEYLLFNQLELPNFILSRVFSRVSEIPQISMFPITLEGAAGVYSARVNKTGYG